MRVVFPCRSASRTDPTRDGPAVRVEALAKRFGDAQAVAGASFEAARGSMTALLGPSGCGKTTILRLIAGFEAPDAGSVSVDGAIVASPTSFTPPERRRVGMVFQDYALFPHLTVRKNVAFGVPRGEGRERAVDAALDLVGVRPEAERLPHELSGGQQQRVALARALAAKPSVVLLDEPFSNLDADLRQRVRGEKRRILREAGATAVFVTHDQGEAFALADAVCIMLRGAVVQCGPPEDVCLRRPLRRRQRPQRLLGHRLQGLGADRRRRPRRPPRAHQRRLPLPHRLRGTPPRHARLRPPRRPARLPRARTPQRHTLRQRPALRIRRTRRPLRLRRPPRQTRHHARTHRARTPRAERRLERFHRTLKEAAMSPPAQTLADQQRAFDAFRRVYNEERPHEALGQRPPASRYAPSPRPYPDKVASPEYPEGVEVRRVRSNGEIKWAGERVLGSWAATPCV